MKTKNTIKYGGIELTKINSKDVLVPTEYQPIDLPLGDKHAVAIAIRDNKSALLIGETGTGKTSVVKELAYLLKAPYVRCSMTGYTTPDELIGKVAVKDGRTYFEYGIITDAMRRGALLVLDEINATTPDSLFILHALFDEDKQITLPHGEIVKPHPNFRAIGTCNPDYEGTKTMNKAFLDRFPIVIEVGVLSVTREKKLLVKRTGITELLSGQLVTLANMIRKAYLEQKILTFCSTRGLLNIAYLISRGLEPKEAYQKAIVSKTNNKDEQKILIDFFLAVFKMANTENNREIPVVITQGELDDYKNARINAEQQVKKAVDNETEIQSTLNKTKDTLQKVKAELETAEKTVNKQRANLKKLTDEVEGYRKFDSILKRIYEAKEGSKEGSKV